MQAIEITYPLTSDEGEVITELHGEAEFNVDDDFGAGLRLDIETIKLDGVEVPSFLFPHVEEYLRTHPFYASKMFGMAGYPLAAE